MDIGGLTSAYSQYAENVSGNAKADALTKKVSGADYSKATDEELMEVCATETYGQARFKPFELLDVSNALSSPLKPSIEVPPILELKPLPPHLKYAYLGNSTTLPVIISSHLSRL